MLTCLEYGVYLGVMAVILDTRLLNRSRTLAGLTLADLAIRAAISQSSVARAMRGPVGTRVAHRLASALGLEPAQLFLDPRTGLPLSANLPLLGEGGG